MWITWHQSVWLAIGCFVAVAATGWIDHSGAPRRVMRPIRWGRGPLREVGIVAALYALWQWVFTLTVTETAGAQQHARRIYDFEQSIGMPSELDLQHLTMRSRVLTEALNEFYAYVHVPAMGAMIIWLFFRHRDRYPRIRNVLALSTGACLAIQSIPVAPPRFLTDLGFVDTGLLYGQSVYGTGGSGLSNQLAAMPSVHVCWSTLVAVAVIWASSSRWRWLIILHPLVTFWAVVATGNHWWADGIVAIGLVAISFGLLEAGSIMWRSYRAKWPGPERPGGVGASAVTPELSPRGFDSRSPSSPGW